MVLDSEFLEDFEMDANDHGEPHWFVDKRIEALKKFEELSYPDSDKIDLNLLKIQELKWKRSDKALIPSINDTENIEIVQVGQRIVVNTLPDELEEQGVIITDVFTAFRQHPRLIQKAFMDKVIKPDEDKLTAFHAAMINSGVFVYVPKELRLNKQINLHVIQDNTLKIPLITHLLIVAENDSSVNIAEDITHTGENINIFNGFTEVLTRANANVELKVTNNLSDKSILFLKDKSYLGRDSIINWQENLKNDGPTYASIEGNLFGSDSKLITTLNLNNDDKEILTNIVKHGKNTVSEFSQNLNN
ncbi:SufD family Fe-S cluster assembly protein [Companilactobacillus hulinensis]|uniref:SufD family Fe-S cluster assembly protein n=1 Tax=Companilactobacillus hulinensis TaxID=2486007 RepID=UPI000F7B7575|nr:SufD family Fe-S cluster assembly protein [Companilactobacillus hulinensis]